MRSHNEALLALNDAKNLGKVIFSLSILVQSSRDGAGGYQTVGRRRHSRFCLAVLLHLVTVRCSS
jgi:hypothetical protein